MSLGLRRAVLFGAPFLAYVAGMLHPTRLPVGHDPWLYIGIHLAWPLLAALLAWMLLLLVDGVDNPAATAVRILVLPFAAVYTLFTTFAGLAFGAFVWKTSELPVAEQPAAVTLIRSVYHSALETSLYWTAGLLWLFVVLATVVALRGRAPLPALTLVALGAAAFAYSHERPWGPGGMAAVLAGVVWLELKPKQERKSRPTKALRFGR